MSATAIAAPPMPPTTAPSGTTVRAMRLEDLPAAAALFARVSELGRPGVEGELAAFFRRAFFECPWADPEIAPLVAEDGRGALAGMIGAQPRRLALDGRILRVASAGFLAVAPGARGGDAGALLLRRLLAGPQDVTVTDETSELVTRIWTGQGGSVMELKGIDWVRIARPWALASGLAAGRLERGRPARSGGALRAVASALDDATALAGRALLVPAPVEATVEPLTPELLLEHLPAVAGDAPRPVYDAEYLRWLFAAMDALPEHGRLVAHLVRSPRGRALGWYVYLLRPGRRSEVLAVAAADRDRGAVVDHLLWHAHEHGSAALRGRLEPGLVSVVARRRCLLWHGGGTLVHARDLELARRITEDAMLTRLYTDPFGAALV